MDTTKQSKIPSPRLVISPQEREEREWKEFKKFCFKKAIKFVKFMTVVAIGVAVLTVLTPTPLALGMVLVVSLIILS